MPGKTNGGLTVINHSRYSTSDIVELLNIIEAKRFGRKGEAVFSQLVANATVTIYQAPGGFKPETVIRYRSIQERSRFAKTFHSRSSRPSSIRVCHPNHAMGPLQQLVSDEAPRIPPLAVTDLVESLDKLYSSPRHLEIDLDAMSVYPVRVVPQIEDKKPREMRRADRLKANKRLNSMESTLGSVMHTLRRQAKEDNTAHYMLANLAAEMDALRASAARLRASVEQARKDILAPNPS